MLTLSVSFVPCMLSYYIYIFILFHQVVVAKQKRKKNRDTYIHICTHTSKQIYINTQIIYIHMRPSTWRQLNWITIRSS